MFAILVLHPHFFNWANTDFLLNNGLHFIQTVPGLQFPSKDVMAQFTLLETFQNILRPEPFSYEAYLSCVSFKFAHHIG